MLGKLLKYDLRGVSAILLIVHAAALFFSFLGFAVMHIAGIRPLDNILSGIYTFTIIIALCVVSVFTTVYLGIFYYRNLYSDEGYLTNTLPVTAGQLLFSKFLCGILWTFLDYLILFLSLSILLNIEIAEALLDSLREVPAGTVLLCLGVFLTELLTSCLMMYCAVAIGNFFHGHRVLGCVGGYLILYLINQILALFFVIPMLVDPTLSAVRAQVSVSTGQYLSWFNRTLAFALVINLLLGFVYYLFSFRSLDRKLEID